MSKTIEEMTEELVKNIRCPSSFNCARKRHCFYNTGDVNVGVFCWNQYAAPAEIRRKYAELEGGE